MAFDLASAKPVTQPNYGTRADGTQKGSGFMGEIPIKNGVMTELSIGVDFDGKETQIPTLVPTLTPEEIQVVKGVAERKGSPSELPKPIIDKAVTFARERMAQGKSPFAQAGEQKSRGFDLASAKPIRDVSSLEKMQTGAAMLAGGLMKPGGLPETALSMVTGGAAMPISGAVGLAASMLPGPPGQGARAVEATQEALTYQPRSAGGQMATTGLQQAMMPGITAARAPGAAIAEAGYPAAGAIASGIPEASMALLGAGPKTTPTFVRGAKAIQARIPGPPPELRPWTGEAGRAAGRDLSAAGTPEGAMLNEAIQAAPESVKMAASSIPAAELNTTALERHAKAQSLPVPVPLTRGMATADSRFFSEEHNLRAKIPALADRFNEYPKIFQQNFEQFREQMAPDVYGTPTAVSLGDELITRYSQVDKAAKAEVDAAYKNLRDAAENNNVQIDGEVIARNTLQQLREGMAEDFLPAKLQSRLEALAQGQPIGFSQLEQLRTIVGREIRAADRAGDGNAKFAAKKFLSNLEDMPIKYNMDLVSQETAANLKALADDARAKAKARFQAIEADPAYDAVVFGEPRADKFFSKFVATAGRDNVAAMKKTLKGTDADQVLKLGILKQLDEATKTAAFAPGERAGAPGMTAAGYDGAFRKLAESGVLEQIYEPKELEQLTNLGDVMRYTQQTGRGGYVNYSGTAVAGASDVFRQQVGEVGRSAVGAALESIGVPKSVTKAGEAMLATVANRKFQQASLEPMAGLRKATPKTQPPAPPANPTPPPAGPPAGPPTLGKRQTTPPQVAPTLASMQQAAGAPAAAPTLESVSQRPTAPPTLAGQAATGPTTKVKFGKTYYPATWKLVDAADQAPTMTLAENQYRDRTRLGSRMQIEEIAQQLDPALVLESPTAEMGAPTMTKDGTILAGNGRMAAIRRAYEMKRAEPYRKAMLDTLSKVGIDPAQAQGMRMPTLVRVLDKDVDVQKLAIESNQGAGLGMGQTERARIDATKLGDLSGLELHEDGSINMAKSRGAVERWMAKFPTSEHADLMDEAGRVGQEGQRRFKNALMHVAYGETDVIKGLMDTVDDTSKNVAKALTLAAPRVAQAKMAMAAGKLHALDISTDIAAAAQVFKDLRKQGMSVADYLSQGEMIGGVLTDIGVTILQFLDANARAPKRLQEFISDYYEFLDEAGNPKQQSMFDEPPPSKTQLLDKAMQSASPQQGLF